MCRVKLTCLYASSYWIFLLGEHRRTAAAGHRRSPKPATFRSRPSKFRFLLFLLFHKDRLLIIITVNQILFPRLFWIWKNSGISITVRRHYVLRLGERESLRILIIFSWTLWGYCCYRLLIGIILLQFCTAIQGSAIAVRFLALPSSMVSNSRSCLFFFSFFLFWDGIWARSIQAQSKTLLECNLWVNHIPFILSPPFS